MVDDVKVYIDGSPRTAYYLRFGNKRWADVDDSFRGLKRGERETWQLPFSMPKIAPGDYPIHVEILAGRRQWRSSGGVVMIPRPPVVPEPTGHIGLSGSIEAFVDRVPTSPKVSEVQFSTRGGVDRLIGVTPGRKIQALRFISCDGQTVREENLPCEVVCGDAQLMVKGFKDGGFLIDEYGAPGVQVNVEVYFDETAKPSTPKTSDVEPEKSLPASPDIDVTSDEDSTATTNGDDGGAAAATGGSMATAGDGATAKTMSNSPGSLQVENLYGGLHMPTPPGQGARPHTTLTVTAVKSETRFNKLLLRVENTSSFSVEVDGLWKAACEGCPDEYQAVWEESPGKSIRLQPNGGVGHLVVVRVDGRRRASANPWRQRAYLTVGRITQDGPGAFRADEWATQPNSDGEFEVVPTPVKLEIEILPDPPVAMSIRRRFLITGKSPTDFDWEEIPPQRTPHASDAEPEPNS